MARRPKVDPLDFSRNRPSWAEELRVKNQNATAEVDAVIAKIVEDGHTVTEQQRRAAIIAKENGRDFDFQFAEPEAVLPKAKAAPVEDDSSIAGVMTNLPAVLPGLADYFMSFNRARNAGKKLSEIQEEEDNSGLVRDFIREATGLEGSLDPRQNAENVMRLISPVYRKVKIEEDRKTRELEKAEAKRVLVEEAAKAKSLEERLGTGLIPRIARVTGGVSADAVEQSLPIIGGILGGPGGAAAGSLPMAQVAYADARREALEQFGATPEEATNYARAMTAVEFGTEAVGGKLAAGAISKLGITKLTKGAVQDALARKVKGRVARVAGAGLAEGFEEVAAEGGGDLIRTGLEQSDALSTEESRAKLKKFNAEQTATTLDRYLDSFIGGKAAGVVISTPAAQLSYASELGKQTAKVNKVSEEAYTEEVEAFKKQEAADLKADTELNEDIRLEQERIAQEQAKEDAFKKAEQDRAKAEEQAARDKEVEEEAAFRTIETEDKFRGKTRVERAGDSLVERVPVNPPAETTPAQVQAEREQAEATEAERVERVELGGLTEQLRKRRESLDTKTAAEQEKADKKAKSAESRRRRVIMDTLIRENPDAAPDELAPMLREKLKAAPFPVEQPAPVAKPAAAPAATQPGTAAPVAPLPEATKPDREMQDDDVEELTNKLAGLGTLNTVGTTPASDTRKQVADFKPKLARAIKNLVHKNSNQSVDVQNLLLQKKVVFAPNPESIGRSETGAASYDTETGKMYVYLDRTDPDDVMAVIANTLHEATHAGQFNDRAGRPSILKQMMGQEKENAVKAAILAADGKNVLATRAVAAAKKASPDTAIQDLELVPYFVAEAANARQGFGRLGGVVRDIKAGAKGFMREQLGVDLDVSLADIDSAAQKVAGEIVKTDVQPALPERSGTGTLNIIGGRNATGFDAAREAGDTFTEEADAKERFEIPDFQAELVDSFTPEGAAAYRNLLDGQTLSLENFLTHDTLFENYPTLKGLKLKVAPLESYAQYTARDRTVTLNRNQVVEALATGNDDFLRNLVLHETQHAVQDIEGFSSGTNKSEFMPRGIVNSFHDSKGAWNHAIEQFDVDRAIAELPFDIRKAWDLYTKFAGYTTHNEKAVGFMTNQEFINNTKSPILKQRAQTYYNATENYDKAVVKYNEAQDKAFTKYLSDLGEAEARNTEQRSRMTPAQIKARPARDTLLQDPQSKEKNLTRADLTAKIGGQRRGASEAAVPTTNYFAEADALKKQWEAKEPDSAANFAAWTQWGETRDLIDALSANVRRYAPLIESAVANTASTNQKEVEYGKAQIKKYTDILDEKLATVKAKVTDKPTTLNSAGVSNPRKAWEGSRVREILLRTLSSSLGAGPQVQELMEHANSAPSKDRMMAEGSLAKYHNALDFEAARRNMTATELNNKIGTEIEIATQDTTGYKANKAAFDSVVDKYGSTGQHLKNLRDQIDTLTREIVRQRIAQGNALTKKEEKLYNKMLTNLGKYNHRQYATNLRDVGDKFSKAVWDAYTKGDPKTRADRENFNRAANGVDWLINHELVIPDDLTTIKGAQLNNLHATWVGGPNASQKTPAQKREELEAVRDDVNNNPERIKAQAERTAQEMLGLIADPGPMATYFRGGKRDNTIIKQRENIPSPLRELMGEVKDVGATLMVTAAKQAEFIARTNMFMELTKVDDGSVAPPSAVGTPAVDNKVKLDGEAYGPMEGWYVVPDLKLMLDDAVAELATFEQATALAVKNPRWFRNAVLTNVADKWAVVAGISKALQIIVQPFNFVYNYAGAYGMMMMNGNASPSAWLKGHKAIVDVVANAMSPAYSSTILTELNQYGVTDSAFVGDLKAEQYQQLARVVKEMSGKSPSQVMATLGKIKIGGKELYAMMDVWSKAANFYHQVDLLTKFYKAEGVPRTDAAIRREAADITNRTNLTYKRAAPIVRGVEAGGGTAYGVYFYEVFRTQVNNVKQAYTELLRANEANTYKGRLLMGSQAVKRIGGQAAFWAGAAAIARTAAEMVFGGEDEEDKRSLLTEWMQDQDFIPVGYDEDGNMTLFQWSRVDPIGPITDLMRAVINKDADLAEVGGKMFDLYVAPRLVPQIVTAVKAITSDTAKVSKDPTLKLVAPDAWSEMTRAMSLNGTFRNEKEVQALWNVVEAFSPGFVSSWRDTNARPAGKDPASEFFNVMTYAGLNLYKMDAKAAATRESRDSNEQLKAARDELALFFDNHPDATPKEVASLISKLEADEQQAFEELSSVYRGAKAIGMSEEDITKQFIAAGVSRKQLAAVRNSKFQPTVVSKKSFETRKAQELADAETDEDKKKVEAEWNKIGQIVEVSQKSLEEEE